jgi:hypothetical protein
VILFLAHTFSIKKMQHSNLFLFALAALLATVVHAAPGIFRYTKGSPEAIQAAKESVDGAKIYKRAISKMYLSKDNNGVRFRDAYVAHGEHYLKKEDARKVAGKVRPWVHAAVGAGAIAGGFVAAGALVNSAAIKVRYVNGTYVQIDKGARINSGPRGNSTVPVPSGNGATPPQPSSTPAKY